jgi:hypothetical protein
MQIGQLKRRKFITLFGGAAACRSRRTHSRARRVSRRRMPCQSSSRRSSTSCRVTGTLKETVQKQQQLVWRARRSPNERRFELTDMSVALLRNEAPGEVMITFAGHVSALGWRPERDPKVEVIICTRGGASVYSWTVGLSVRCADTNRPLPPLSQTVPNDIASNLFNAVGTVGTVEISEYREPNSPILTARQCPTHSATNGVVPS